MGRWPERRGNRKYWALAAGVVLAVVLAVAFVPGDEPEPPTLLAPPPAAMTEHSPATPRADPVLSRARAALAAGRYEAPEGRNALDLYRAVLLAKPDHAEARTGLVRTLDAIVIQAQQRVAGGDRAEAERLLHRVLEAEPTQSAAQALLARLQPPEPGAAESTTAPMTAVPAASPATEVLTHAAPAATVSTSTPVPRAQAVAPPAVSESTIATAPPAATERAIAKAPPATTERAIAQAPPAASAQLAAAPAVKPAETAASRPRSTRPAPDPLQPRLAMQSPKPKSARGRVFGAPISSGHATAGIDTRPTVAEPSKPARSSSASSNAAASTLATSATPRGLAAEAPPPRPEPVHLDSRELEQVSIVDPVYPSAAMRNRQEGWVTLEFTVTEKGSVRDPWVSDAEPAGVFDAAAVAAVEQWRFKPRVANGREVEVRSSVTLRFAVDR
jgi:protein TonB